MLKKLRSTLVILIFFLCSDQEAWAADPGECQNTKYAALQTRAKQIKDSIERYQHQLDSFERYLHQLDSADRQEQTEAMMSRVDRLREKLPEDLARLKMIEEMLKALDKLCRDRPG